MRIGIDCRLWDESGVGRYIRNLVEQLMILDDANEYVLFVLSKDIDKVKSQKLKVKTTGEKSKVDDSWKIVKADIRWHTIDEQLRFPKIIESESLDLVHFPYFSVPVWYSKPFVVTIHDLIIYHYPTGKASTLPLPIYKLKHFGYKMVVSNAAKRACKIIAPLNATKGDIVKTLHIPKDKVVVTYEGVDNNLKVKSQKSKVQVKAQNYFLYVGNAYPHKNLDRLLEAFSLLIKEHKDFSLVFVGREDYFYKRMKEKVRKMALSDHVIFYGEASDSELVGLYQNARALVLPSLMEGFGLPALEAMENKCLVLASDIAALREVCADSAVYFNPLDTIDIKEKIELVLDSNDMYHYSDKIKTGQKRTIMFSWEKMTEETLRIYEGCLSLR